MAIARRIPPPEEDLQPAVRDELKKPPVEAHPHTSVPGQSTPSLEHARNDYFSGQYAASQPAVAPHDMSMHQLLAKFQLPESLGACVGRLMAIARSHGLAEAIVAAGKDPALDGRQRDGARQLLAFVLHDDHKPRA